MRCLEVCWGAELAFRSQANLTKDLDRMFTKTRRMPAQPVWSGSEADRLSNGVIGPLGRMLADRYQIDSPDMEIITDLFDRQHRHAGNVSLVAKSDPIGCRALRRLFPNHRIERFDRSVALAGIGIAHFPVGPTDGVEEGKPVLRGVRKNARKAIGGPERSAFMRLQSRPAGRTPRRGVDCAAQSLNEIEVDGDLKHRHFDRLPTAAARTLQQATQNRVDDRLGDELVANDCR